jgi:hypothetical protein
MKIGDIGQDLKKLESNFDPARPLYSKMAAEEVGRLIGSMAAVDLQAFHIADKRITAIAERLIGNGMGAVVGSVERAFHDEVQSKASQNDVLRDNARAKKERGL